MPDRMPLRVPLYISINLLLHMYYYCCLLSSKLSDWQILVGEKGNRRKSSNSINCIQEGFCFDFCQPTSDMLCTTDDGCMIRKWPGEHGRELHPKSKFLVTTEAYLSATFGQNISDFFDLYLHWVSVVRESTGWKADKSYLCAVLCSEP